MISELVMKSLLTASIKEAAKIHSENQPIFINHKDYQQASPKPKFKAPAEDFEPVEIIEK